MAGIKQRTLGIVGQAIGRLAPIATPAPLSGELARALPDSKGGEEPKDMQRWRADGYVVFTTTLGVSTEFYATDQWVRVKFSLETAGPVAIGLGRANIVPVLSGKGRLLATDQEWEVFVPKGTRLYYAASSVNRFAFTIEPIPWLEQLGLETRRVAAAVVAAAGSIVAAVGGQAPPPAPAGPPSSLPASLQPRSKLSQLTPMRIIPRKK